MKQNPLYKEIADKIETLIEQGSLKEGEKIPSIRDMSSQLGVSLNTIKESYWHLERKNYIEAVPQSGFYVNDYSKIKKIKNKKSNNLKKLNPQNVSLCKIYGALKEDEKCVPGAELGIGVTDPALWPTDKLYRYYNEALRNNSNIAFDYCLSPGYRSLREQIAVMSLKYGMSVSADDVIITSGCTESIYLALQCVCEKGDTIAVESPVYFNLFHMCELLELNVIEIPCKPDSGISIDTLEFAFEKFDLKAVIVISAFSNPTGASISEDDKKRLVELIEKKDSVLIEDGIYSELVHSGKVPSACKSFEKSGNVIYCSSFSKFLAVGVRVGWVVPGKFYQKVDSHKNLLNLGTSALPQMAISKYLQEGGVEKHLRKIRKILFEQCSVVRKYIIENFPKGTEVSNPQGGFLLWVKLPGDIDTYRLYEDLIEKNIIIGPGSMFTMSGKYSNYMRINAGIWNRDIQAQLDIVNLEINSYLK